MRRSFSYGHVTKMTPTPALLEHATRVAKKLDKDPEMESIAGEATLIACRSFDPTVGLSIEQWTAFVVKNRVGDYWRTRNCRPMTYMDPELLDEPLDHDDEPSEYDHVEWRLLVEKYIDKRPDWSLARQYGCTEYEMRKRVAAATARFLQHMGA